MPDEMDSIVVADPDASVSTRPRRTKNLTTKAQENLQASDSTASASKKTGAKASWAVSKNDDAQDEDESRKANSSADAGTAMLQKVFGVLRILRDEFSKEQESTRSVISEQQKTIRELERQLFESQQQLKQIREQLDVIMKCPAITASTQTSPQASYAEMARTPPTSQPSNVRSLTSMNTTPSTFTDAPLCFAQSTSPGQCC